MPRPVRLSAVAVLLTLALTLTGCPAAGVFLLTGTWSGMSDCVIGLSINGSDPLETEVRRMTTVTFDGNGRPTNLGLAAAAFAAAQQLDINLVGQTKSYESQTTINNVTYTSAYEVVVEEAEFGEDSARIVYSYTLEITAPSFSQTGAGTATYDITLIDDNSIDYTLTQETDLLQMSGNLELDTTVFVDCQGTLTRVE